MTAETVNIRIPEPHFTLFNAQREGMAEVIVVNDALLAVQPTSRAAVKVWSFAEVISRFRVILNSVPWICAGRAV